MRIMTVVDWTAIRSEFIRQRGTRNQGAIAEAGGLHQSAISKLESNDKLGPAVETFVRAIQGLGVSVSEFFAEIEAREKISLQSHGGSLHTSSVAVGSISNGRTSQSRAEPAPASESSDVVAIPARRPPPDFSVSQEIAHAVGQALIAAGSQYIRDAAHARPRSTAPKPRPPVSKTRAKKHHSGSRRVGNRR